MEVDRKINLQEKKRIAKERNHFDDFPPFPGIHNVAHSQPCAIIKVGEGMTRVIQNQCIQDTHRDIYQHIGDQLGIKYHEEWYNVTRKDVIKHGGGSILYHHYENSPSTALISLYPNTDWQIWKFQKVPHNYWFNMYNQRLFFDWMAENMEINSLSDWYNIENKDICKQGGGGLLILYDNSIFKFFDISRRRMAYLEI
jgi:hypothetical protein